MSCYECSTYGTACCYVLNTSCSIASASDHLVHLRSLLRLAHTHRTRLILAHVCMGSAILIVVFNRFVGGGEARRGCQSHNMHGGRHVDCTPMYAHMHTCYAIAVTHFSPISPPVVRIQHPQPNIRYQLQHHRAEYRMVLWRTDLHASHTTSAGAGARGTDGGE